MKWDKSKANWRMKSENERMYVKGGYNLMNGRCKIKKKETKKLKKKIKKRDWIIFKRERKSKGNRQVKPVRNE